MIEAPIDSITEEHLQQLLGRPENRRLDFKADLPDPKDKKKCNDMVADIVAFANSEGGDIVYGIEEEDGVAARIRPVTLTLSLDKEIQRIYSWARDNIDVRLPAFGVLRQQGLSSINFPLADLEETGMKTVSCEIQSPLQG